MSPSVGATSGSASCLRPCFGKRCRPSAATTCGTQLAHANATYGFFAIVIGLLSWLFVAAQLTLYAAEINVVRKHHLWPRSLTQPPLTQADRAMFVRLAMMEERRPEVKVSVSFTTDADRQPLDEVSEGDSAADAADAPEPAEPADPLGRSA